MKERTYREPQAEWAGTVKRRRACAADGCGLHYEVVGQGERTLVLANGLGGRLYAWKPLIDAYWRTHRIITWDYRGLFESDSPESARRLSIAHHVEDALTIMKAEHVDQAVFVGWSMGVQVSLDLAATHPEKVLALVLLNGTYGHVLSTGFQPLVSIPWLSRVLHAALEWFYDRPAAANVLSELARIGEVPSTLLMSLTAGRQGFTLRPMLRRYFDDVLGPSFRNYLRLFQELDAHSVYHLLREIEAPALVVSGALDVLTPSYQSRQIVRRMPRAERLALLRASHFALIERPETVVPAIQRFLDEKVIWGASAPRANVRRRSTR